MIIIFIGPPFSGKGEQSKLLSQRLKIPVFSMGGIIRDAYKAGDKRAVEGFEKYSMKGLHVPIDLKFPLLEEKLHESKTGFILDNFPATEEDLQKFIDYLNENKLVIDKVFYIHISREEMQRRAKVRKDRPDDDLMILLKRREVQDKDRQPVIDYFKKQNLLVEINGEGDIGEIHKKVVENL